MRRNLKIILALFVLLLLSAYLAGTAQGSWIDTLNIIRQNPPSPPTTPAKPEPPSPPTPPTKPEPSAPPTPPCGDPGCPTPTPKESPKPSESPSPTPSATEPPTEGGTGGFQFGGPPPPPPAQPQVLGLSETSSGNTEAALFTLGAIWITLGLKLLSRRPIRP